MSLAWLKRLSRIVSSKPGATIVEATSVNTGIGLSWAGAAKGYKRQLSSCQKRWVWNDVRLSKPYGAELSSLHLVAKVWKAIAKAQEIAAERGGFLPLQFNNPANPESTKEQELKY